MNDSTDPEITQKSFVAPLGRRFGALFVDVFVIGILVFLLVSNLVIGRQYPGGSEGYSRDATTFFEDFLERLDESKTTNGELVVPEIPVGIQQVALKMVQIFFWSYFIYFVIIDRFLDFSSLGKRLFNLRVESIEGDPEDIGVFRHMIRGLLKTITVISPFLLGNVFFLLLFISVSFFCLFNAQRLSLHDRVSKTKVSQRLRSI